MGNGQGKPVDLNGEVNLNHFRLLRVVGRGAFGKVRIVERKDTNLSFALKYIRKDEGMLLLLGEDFGVAEYSSLSCLNVGGEGFPSEESWQRLWQCLARATWDELIKR
ncbi:hypothetical protein E4U16_005054 [Claviceps sp. LM84 group G4]|nr:hypothetical protein E4U33_004819 [Claviceps sp. LM78 group G4]KAG6083034.1 hypothetical protein E4U16_005054 [Claviceps sp. LM84 group G4]